ncbi:MAG: redoxin domain-containing protein [Acidobacteriota bacterium]|nr:redoxin domain-containing protein [Acidobacteriota bacterium]
MLSATIPSSYRKIRTATLALTACALLVTLAALPARAATPNVGDKAPDFALKTPEGKSVSLHGLLKKGPVVLILLRGYPGYQCPYCQRQAHDFQVNAEKFADKGVQLLLVYPGPAADLGEHAKEFLNGYEKLPTNYHLVLDPDYAMTRAYDLRWDAPRETAYPSTFVLNRNGVVTYRKISHTHGDRTTADEILGEFGKAI